MAAKPVISVQGILEELLFVDRRTRELLFRLDTSVAPLEYGGGSTTSSTMPEETDGPENVERLCENLISTLKSIAAGTRKFCDLNQPQRREQTTRRSYRQDSGIGSGYFPAGDEDAKDLNSKSTSEVMTHPIQESIESQCEDPESEVSTAVEHTDISESSRL